MESANAQKRRKTEEMEFPTSQAAAIELMAKLNAAKPRHSTPRCVLTKRMCLR